MGSNALPPLHALTDNDHGAIVVVVGYCFAGITLTTSLLRLFVTVKHGQGFRRDDVAYVIAAVLAVTTSVLCDCATGVGLGQHIDQVTQTSRLAFYRLTYGAALVAIFAMLAAKISVSALYERLAPGQHQYGLPILYISSIVWALFALSSQAFQCGATVVYVPDQCVTHGILQYPSVALNIVTDGMLAFWMTPRIWSLEMSHRRKVLIISLFALRLVTCFVGVAQIVVLALYLHNQDWTWAAVVPWSVTIVVVHVSVITAALPRIKNFIADIQTGQIGLRIPDRNVELMEISRRAKDSNEHSASRSPFRSKGKSRAAICPRPNKDRMTHSSHVFGRSTRSNAGYDDALEPSPEAVETGSQSSLHRNAVYHGTEFR